MPTLRPNLTIQTASLYASGDDSYFSGTGGPQYWDPFTSEFYDTVSSAGIAGEPFADKVYKVDAGDQVSFVIAVQNFGNVAGFDVKIRDILPVGFALLDPNLTVTDGAGNDLAFTGDLWDPAGGLLVTPAIGAYSDGSGLNLILITFTAAATNDLALPGATVTNGAQIVGYASSHGGANLAAGGAALSATTPVQTDGFTVISTANQPPATLLAGQTASFDIKVTLPEGSVPDFRIDEVLPQIGTSWLQLVSAEIISVGGNLTASAPVFVLPDGNIHLGTVVDAFDNLVTPDDTITVRLTVRGAGTAAGTGTINTVVSTADPNGGATRIAQTVTNTVTLGAPNTPPTVGGTSGAQFATSSTLVLPFRTLTLTDPDTAQQQTLTIHLSDRSLGTLSAPAGLTTTGAGDYVLTGTAAAAQALARTLVFTPAAGAAGTETFGLSLDDGTGGVATGQAALTIAPALADASAIHFPISAQTVLTSTVQGSSTFSLAETYGGAIGDLGSQFLYDGATDLAIVAQQNGMLISSLAPQTAVQLQGGANVVEMKQGSGFLVGGAGADILILHADQAAATWNTVVGFGAGDTVLLYGVNGATSARWWTDSAGAPGYTGATLRIDVDGDGRIDSSVTFAGRTLADTSHYGIVAGTVGNAGYLSITPS